PGFDAASASPDINKLSTKQSRINPLKFVQVAKRLLGLPEREKLPFHKPVWNGREYRGGEVLATYLIEVGSHAARTYESDKPAQAAVGLASSLQGSVEEHILR